MTEDGAPIISPSPRSRRSPGSSTASAMPDGARRISWLSRRPGACEPVIMRQIHSDTVHRLDAAPAGKLEGDALMTNVAGLLLVIRTADCLPVLLVDEANRAVAAVHCGWRGTEKRILEKAVLAMAEALRVETRGDAGGAGALHRRRPATRSGRRSGRLPEGRLPAVRLRAAPRAREKSPSSTSGPPTPGSSESWVSRRGISSIPARPAPTASRRSSPTAATPTTPAAWTTSSALS